MTIQIYQDSKQEWRWRAIAANGRIVADGAEGYDSRGNALRAVRTLLTDLSSTVVELQPQVDEALHARRSGDVGA